MRGKGLLVVGALAGIVFAMTPKGRQVIDDVKDRAESLWRRPEVQRRVGDAQDAVRRVPVVGDNVADAIGRARPESGEDSDGTGNGSGGSSSATSQPSAGAGSAGM